MTLATLVLNDQVQKLSEGNQRLKAQIHLQEKQLKTSDPDKKLKFHKQIDELSKAGTLQKYYVNETYPPPDSAAYVSDKERYELWKKTKIEGVDEVDSGFVRMDALRAGEATDHLFPGSVYQGTRFLGNTYTRNREEAEYHENSQKSDYGKSSQAMGGSNSGTMGGRKRRYRRRANQISRSYVCAITTCRKAYGSEGSLNQHMKIKHPEYYQNSDLSGRRRGRIGNRHFGFLGPMQPPPPLNQFQMMQNQYQRY
jgi:hypothetical protein